MATRSPLSLLVQRSAAREPTAVARDLEAMEEQAAVGVLRALPATAAAQLLPHLQPSHAAALLREAPAEFADTLVQRMQPEQAGAILMTLPADVRQVFVDRLPEELKRQLRELLVYPKDSAGQMMTTEFLALRAGLTVRDAVQRIRTLATRKAPTTYTYVVDDRQRLLSLPGQNGCGDGQWLHGSRRGRASVTATTLVRRTCR
jgi:magnesium transporter